LPPASPALLHPAETLDRKLTENALKEYIGVTLEPRPEENVAAFSRAAVEKK
jgi:hypothetical protein